jgi:hypothetical protein
VLKTQISPRLSQPFRKAKKVNKICWESQLPSPSSAGIN